MKTYKLVAKFDGELDSDHIVFQAKNQDRADDNAWQFNRYHGQRNSPGWGFQIAIEAPGATPTDHFTFDL